MVIVCANLRATRVESGRSPDRIPPSPPDFLLGSIQRRTLRLNWRRWKRNCAGRWHPSHFNYSRRCRRWRRINRHLHALVDSREIPVKRGRAFYGATSSRGDDLILLAAISAIAMPKPSRNSAGFVSGLRVECAPPCKSSWKQMALGVAEMRHFKRNRGSARRRVPKGAGACCQAGILSAGLTTLSNPPNKCCGCAGAYSPMLWG